MKHTNTWATWKIWPRTYCAELVQKGPRSFFWQTGSFRLSGSPFFRTAAAAIEWAQAEGMTVA